MKTRRQLHSEWAALWAEFLKTRRPSTRRKLAALSREIFRSRG